MTRSISGLTRDQRTALSRGRTEMAKARDQMMRIAERIGPIPTPVAAIRFTEIRLGMQVRTLHSPARFEGYKAP